MKNGLTAFFMQKKEVQCMGYARKDVEKTKKIAQIFVRYQEWAEFYISEKQTLLALFCVISQKMGIIKI